MLTNIPSSTLKQLVRLSERKEALMAQIQEIDREMIRVQNKFGIPSRDALKEKILRSLRSAGKKGATVSELSKNLKVPSANLYVWFNGTGRSVPGIKKVGVAKYQLR